MMLRAIMMTTPYWMTRIAGHQKGQSKRPPGAQPSIRAFRHAGKRKIKAPRETAGLSFGPPKRYFTIIHGNT
jgi:hypothetical protein